MINKHKFSDSIKLYNLADVHRAHPGCDAAFLNTIIGMIKDDPSAYWVSTGDLGELALSGSKGDVYTTESAQWELDKLTEELSPIGGKCLGFTFSNHHKRVQSASGLDFDMVLSKQIGVPYLGKTGCLNLVVGKASYYVVLHHGVGGGGRGNKINRAKMLSTQRPGADLYLTGHVHTYDAFPVFQKHIDKKKNEIAKMVCWHQIGGHFLQYDDSYADMMMLEESPVACGMVELAKDVKQITCRMITP